jgi:hypothetical protein
MNAIWQRHAAEAAKPRKVAPRTTRAKTRAPRAPKPTSNTFPCSLRTAERIGQLVCSCASKPHVFGCHEFRQCIVKPLPNLSDGRVSYTSEGLAYIGGGPPPEVRLMPWFDDKPAGKVSRDEIAGIPRIAVCALCDNRQAPEAAEMAPESTPVAEPVVEQSAFPAASDATVGARTAICGACDRRADCRKPDLIAESLKWRLEACPDGRWRAEA